MSPSKFGITINGKECASTSDLTNLSLFSGVARAVQHLCPPGSLHDGYNEIHIQQLADEPEQTSSGWNCGSCHNELLNANVSLASDIPWPTMNSVWVLVRERGARL
jgi:hypothetical protein